MEKAIWGRTKHRRTTKGGKEGARTNDGLGLHEGISISPDVLESFVCRGG